MKTLKNFFEIIFVIALSALTAACAENYAPQVMAMAASAKPPEASVKRGALFMIDEALHLFHDYRDVEISNVYEAEDGAKWFFLKVYDFNSSRSRPYTKRSNIFLWMKDGQVGTKMSDDVFCEAPNLVWTRAPDLDHEAAD